MTINLRLTAIRKEMRILGIDAYIVPSGDPHKSEYVPDRWNSRAWISGFDGSSGTAIITQDHAGVWTDSRYFIQAAEQLSDSDFELHKLEIPHTPEHLLWLRDNLEDGATIGFDAWMNSPAQARQLAKALAEKNIVFNSEHDLIGKIWDTQPIIPTAKVFELDEKYAGQSRTEKFKHLRTQIKKNEGKQYLVTTLDDIAWLLNLRGNDVDCNPVFVGYVVVTENDVQLFVNAKKFKPELKLRLENDGVVFQPYSKVESYLKKIEENILVDRATVNLRLYNSIPEKFRIETKNIIEALKTIKNDIEIKHFRSVMVKDGVALVRLFRWLEQQLKRRTVSEVELAEKLKKLRKAQGEYYGESFDAIVGYKGNGAIVHYKPKVETCANMENEGMLLLDSGGQFFNGTTDITRTISFNEPTEQQILDFTLVLKGHIALAMARFPEGTNGVQLDTIARQHLWRYQRNFGHGTGHGVGFFLNVHEGPQRIGPTIGAKSKLPFQSGMVTSNEPGIYRANEYGIRIENLILCKEAAETDFGKFLEFETITLFPIQQKLIDKSLLSKDEKDWLNNYHQKVFDQLSPQLNKAEVSWLKRECRLMK